MPTIPGRRGFLAALSATGAADILGPGGVLANDGPPEVTTIRLLHSPTICVAPDLITEALLRAPGFTDILQELRACGIGRVMLDTAGAAVVAVFLLPAAGQPRVCPRPSGGEQARAPRGVQGDRLLRRRACAGRTPAGRARLCGPPGSQTLHEVPFNAWRDYDPEDALRFYALRLHQVGMIRSDPDTLIARGTDWRFLDELKRELKA